jgi:tetratricopeptide (TPR) repeat protein
MKTTNQEALRLRQLGLDAMWQGRFDDAIALYDEAIAFAEDDEARELITIGKAEALMAADRDGAEVTALPAIVMRRRTPRHVFLAAYALMRRYHESDRRRALFYGEIARDAATELEDAFAQAKVLNTIGIVLTVESRFTEAAESFEKSVAVLSQVKDRENEVAIARSSFVANLGGAKVLGGQFEEGIAILLAVVPELKDDYSYTEALLDLCFGYIEQERYAEAEFIGREALDRATVRRQIRNANHLLGEIMVRTDRYDEADRYFSTVAEFYPEYKNVKELLFTVDLCAVVNWKG